MLAYLKANKRTVDTLLVVKWDRFSRNIAEAYSMIDVIENLGISVEAITQELDPTVPESDILKALYLAVPQAENRRRALNTQMGMRRARLEGRWCGTPPKGYVFKRDIGEKSQLVFSNDAPLVLEAFTEIAKGIYTQEEVRLRLRKKGLKISKNAFCNMLRNPVYVGKIRVEAWGDEEEKLVDGPHRPIVSPSLFERVQNVLNTRLGRRKDKPTNRHEELPLRGFLKCRQCGGNLSGSRSKSRSGKYYWYYLQKEIGAMNERLLKLHERYFVGDFDKEGYQMLRASFHEQKEELEARRDELESMDTNFDKYIRYGLSLLSGLPRYYREASLPVKQKLVGSIFPEKLIYDHGKYRTTKMNEVLTMLIQKEQEFNEKQKRTDRHSVGDQSCRVGPTGFEPVTSRV